MRNWDVTDEELQWLRALRGEHGSECQTEALRHLLGDENPGPTPAIVSEPPGSYRVHDGGPVVCYWQVRCGLVPGFSDPALTRQFCMTGGELDALDFAGQRARFRQLAAYAWDYFQQQTNPETANWAVVEWVWL